MRALQARRFQLNGSVYGVGVVVLVGLRLVSASVRAGFDTRPGVYENTKAFCNLGTVLVLARHALGPKFATCDVVRQVQLLSVFIGIQSHRTLVDRRGFGLL